MAQKKLPIINLENYEKEQAKQREHAQKLNAAANEASSKVKALKLRYEETLISSVLDDKDATKELAAIEAEITAAEGEARAAKSAAETYRKLAPQLNSKKDELKADFATFTARYDSEHVTPALEAMKAAKEAYIEAALQYERVKNHHEGQALQVAHALGYQNEIYPTLKLARLRSYNRPEMDRYRLTPKDAEKLSRGIKPQN